MTEIKLYGLTEKEIQVVFSKVCFQRVIFLGVMCKSVLWENKFVINQNKQR